MPGDAQQQRQRTYWRALKTLEGVERIEGHFARWEKYMPLCDSVRDLEAREARGEDITGLRPEMVRVLRSEEKGSDVNLAAHLVHDANQQEPSRTFEVALVISTDADLAGAITLVTREARKPVYVCKPSRGPARLLAAASTGVFTLDPKVLRASVFADELEDERGVFSKPESW